MARFTVQETIETLERVLCAMTFGVSGRFVEDRRNDHKIFFCPAGHSNLYSEDNAEEKMRRERDIARQQLARVEDEKLEALRAIERAKAETKKLKKRAASGTCPCCRRSFSNMTEHMKKQHPKFVVAEVTNVVPIKKKNMMRLALGFSTKDQVELTKQTIEPLLQPDKFDLYWCDGSDTDEGRSLPRRYGNIDVSYNVRGGADSAIAWKLSQLLAASQNYTHIGLVENDVLLDPDWLESTMALFEKGKQDGLSIGAVSARSYVDRILIQRDSYAIMHNVGAGMVIFTREAAEIALRSFRTHWWPDNVRLFAQLSGIDLRTYACFRGQEQFVTTDWGWEAQLARHGMATLALTPAKCQMIGQVPSLKEQGLELVRLDLPGTDDQAFDSYRTNLDSIRQGKLKLDGPNKIHRQAGGMLFFPHQMGHVPGSKYDGAWRLKWTQGWGPFAYRVGPSGASLSARISGSCSYLVSGGVDGATVSITDIRSGFKAEPQLSPEQGSFIEVNVPGGPVPREIILKAHEGAVFYGLQTVDPQMIDTTFKFSWDQLPEV